MPPAGLLTYRRRHARPYLYSDAEIGRLLSAALDLTPAPRAATYHTMIGLLAVSGMRVGEALRLDRDDVDLSNGLLRVRVSKFGKSREVPVHPSTVTMLARYANLRNEAYPRPKHPELLPHHPGDQARYHRGAQDVSAVVPTRRTRGPEHARSATHS